MELRGNDAYQRIQSQYNGVLDLCKRLYTSPTEGRPAHSSTNLPIRLSSFLFIYPSPFPYYGWLRGTAVERRSFARELSPSGARPVADGWCGLVVRPLRGLFEFWEISDNISETVHDRQKVATED